MLPPALPALRHDSKMVYGRLAYAAEVWVEMMPSFTLRSDPCRDCPRTCKVVRCPKCRRVRWLEDWEVYDDFAMCPACDESVPSYQPMNLWLLCRKEVDAEVQKELEAEKKPSRNRPVKPTPGARP